jgi:hypothetical protein
MRASPAAATPTRSSVMPIVRPRGAKRLRLAPPCELSAVGAFAMLLDLRIAVGKVEVERSHAPHSVSRKAPSQDSPSA